MATPTATPMGSVGMQDMLSALKNVVQALNAATQAYISVNGTSTEEGITTPTVLKTSSGRAASVSILVAGSTTGMLYDSPTTALNEPLYVIPNTVGIFIVNLPTDAGLLVVPGTGQSVTVNWS